MALPETFDAVVIGGGPAGATAASDLAGAGRSVLLLDRAGRSKLCGGAIPPRLIRDFAIPDHLLVAKITAARIVAPSGRNVDMTIDGGYVGMVEREVFDEWLRDRAARRGAVRRTGAFVQLRQEEDGHVTIEYRAASLGRAASGARPGGDRRRRRAFRRRETGPPRQQAGALRVRLSRDHPVPARPFRVRCRPLRRVLSGGAIAGLLRLDLPPRRDGQRGHRFGREGFCAPRRGRRAPRRRWAGADGNNSA